MLQACSGCVDPVCVRSFVGTAVFRPIWNHAVLPWSGMAFPQRGRDLFVYVGEATACPWTGTLHGSSEQAIDTTQNFAGPR